jgi:hypothetical protein
MDNPGKRLIILSRDEIDSLYGRPHFTQEERVEYFTLSDSERAACEQLHSYKSRLFFILQLGYFKARCMFFLFDLHDVQEDAAYIRERYFPSLDDAEPEIAKAIPTSQQRLIIVPLSIQRQRTSILSPEEQTQISTSCQPPNTR